MTLVLKQRQPGPIALKKGIASLLAGEEARYGGRWQLLSPPDGLKGPGPVRARNVDRRQVVAPDHQDALGGRRPTGRSADEHMADHARQQVA